ncbi:MAG: DNA-directed RNA polymerase subunit alpha C-terminal domain-containing protein, partial [Acidobacteriota bacterium]
MAYHIFSGVPPAANLTELNKILAEHQGLPLGAVLDGVYPRLQELIRESTRPEVLVRTESAADFLAELDRFEEEVTSPAEDPVVNPLEAKPGDRLPGGLAVKARLGGGSISVALLVERGDKTMVLKVARRPEDNERIRAEHRILKQLRHPRIVAPEDEELTMAGLAGFLMERAGEETLAVRLKREGRLSLDLLQRFGEDLLAAVQFFEEQGVAHRDLKPDNIGIAEYGRNHELRLKVFDFSLSSTPIEQVRAGTPQYLEPFLQLRGRWDSHAERFAAAMILHEMATGTMPRWGDGTSAPHLLQVEATIESDLIDAPVRAALHAFFTKALKRDPKERFDNAADMLTAWHQAFAQSGASDSRPPDQVARGVALATVEQHTLIHELGLSTRAANALDRLSIFTAGELARQSPSRFYHLPGVGDKTRKEFISLAAELRRKFPESAIPEREKVGRPAEAAEEAAGQAPTVDALTALLLPAEASRAGKAYRRLVAGFLDLDDSSDFPPAWPSQSDVAQRLGVTRARIGQVLTQGRARWRKMPALTEVRNELAEFLATQGGVAEANELAQFLLTARPSEAAEPLRRRRAAAVVRAALEAERASEQPRFAERRQGRTLLIAREREGEADGDAALEYAVRLGREAARLAAMDPLPSPDRVRELLRTVPSGHVSLSDARLVRLAAGIEGVAVSPRLELYPRGMDALRALKLA